MESKIIRKGNGVQEKIIAGVIKSVDAIQTTMGPAGKAVAITTDFGTEITRDGATVAKSVFLSDREENIGADLVKKAAERTEDQAGDATTSTSVLIREFCVRGQKAVTNGANVNELKAGMLKAQNWMTEYIKNNAIEIDGDLEKIHKVATISANNDPSVGDLVVKGMKEVGIDGLITADVASGLDTVVDITTGMKLDKGWSSPQYVTIPEEGTCVMENPYILVAGEKISAMPQLFTLLEDYQHNSQGRPLLMIVDDIDEVVNTTLVFNVLRGAIRACVVKGLDFGDNRKNTMADVAAMVGADYICAENGTTVATATLASLGGAKKVVVARDHTIIYEGVGDPEIVNDRAAAIKTLMNAPTCSEYDKMKFKRRLGNLTGGVAVIRAGGASEAERSNKRATIEDSILAAKSAIEEGCCPGGGYVFFKGAQKALKDKAFWKGLSEDEAEGAKIVFKSLPVILKTIADNSGAPGEVILETVKGCKEGIGYNAKTKKFGNLIEEGILDSAKALRVSLENSVSAAAMILLIDCTIFAEPEKDKDPGAAAVGM